MKLVNTILQGDAIERLKDIEDNTIQCVVTSPPYWGLRDYGKENQIGLEETPEEYVNNIVNVFREVKRALKDDGTLWLNLGDSYGEKKQLIGIPWRVAFALQADGWYLRQDIIWHKPNPMPESVTDRCTKSHEYIFLLTKSANYYYDANAIKEPAQDWGTRDRSNFRKGTKDKLLIHHGLKNANFAELGRNKRSVWKINIKPYKDAHFATFPEELPTLCIKAGSKENDIVLDPFFGSGTTGYVAQRLYRKWLGIELNPEYIKMANKRFSQQALFIKKQER